MADQTPTGPLEMGAAMDYSEHEATYNRFLTLTKYGTIAVASLMIAMAFGFFAGGFFSGIILFIVLVAVGSFAAS